RDLGLLAGSRPPARAFPGDSRKTEPRKPSTRHFTASRPLANAGSEVGRHMRKTKHVKVLGVLGVLLGCTFLESANAARPTMGTIPVRTSAADEYDPSSQGEWFSWAQASHAHPNHPNVFVQQGSGPRIKVNAPGTSAYESGIDGNTLVYYEYRG